MDFDGAETLQSFPEILGILHGQERSADLGNSLYHY